MSKKLPFKPVKCYVWLDLDKSLVTGSDRTPYVYRRKHKGLDAALLVPRAPRGHEWVLKPTAGKGMVKNPKEPKRG